MILIPATAFLFLGQYLFMKTKKSLKELEEIEKCRSFMFDFVNQVDDLPLDKTICLSGSIGSLEQTEAGDLSFVNVSLATVEKSISQNDSENSGATELVHETTTIPLNASFFVQNSLNQKILVKPEGETIFVLFHNVRNPQNSVKPDAVLAQSPFEERFERLSSLIDGRKYEKKLVGLEVGESYTFIGSIARLKEPFRGAENNELIEYALKPKIVSANQRDYIMKYLDDRLGRRIKDTKILLITAIGLGALSRIGKKSKE